MSLKHTLRTLLLVLVLGVALLAGAPIPPDEIQELLSRLNQPKVAHTLRQEKDDGEKLRD